MLLSMLGLVARNARVTGSARFKGEELLSAPENRLNQIRGSGIGLVFQDPMTSLNPFQSIGLQLTEPVRIHKGADRGAAAAHAIEMLKAVHITDRSGACGNIRISYREECGSAWLLPWP